MKKISILLITVCSSLLIQAQTSVKAGTKPQVGLEIGNIAPDISLPNPDGKSIALSSLRGNVVLIDFWASWCRPCRVENPHVVAAYNKYRTAKFKGGAKSFTVYSVSLDQSKDKWVNGIQQDNLTWPYHVSDLKFWYSPVVSTYGVQGIPANWLIDEKGVIVAKNLRGSTLEMALENLKMN